MTETADKGAEDFTNYAYAAEDGWQEWNGGACPVGLDVRVDFRDCGRQNGYFTAPAGTINWTHWGSSGDIVAYRIALRQSDTSEGGGAKVRPLDTAPSGEDAMEPSEIDVHEGAWALIIGTNGKPAGWVDTHALFAHQLYCDQILPVNKSPTPEHVEGDVLSVEPATHLLDWLEDAFTHCQHGSKEWCEGYLHNARDVIAAAQSSIQRAERERDALARHSLKAGHDAARMALEKRAAEAQLADAVKVLKEIATGRDAEGMKSDFPSIIAGTFLDTLSTIGEKPDAE